MNEEKHWKMPDWIRMNMISKEGAFTMAKVFITLTGTKHYFGNDFLEKGTKIRLEKEPDNEYDKEAIKVTYEGLGKIGYVANSSYTVIGESMSAGRLYDKIGDVAYARVVRMFLTNLNYTLRIRRMAHIFPRTFADLLPL